VKKPKKQPNHANVSLDPDDMRAIRKIQMHMLEEEEHPRVTRGTALVYAARKFAETLGE
jgi:hypothetical protein